MGNNKKHKKNNRNNFVSTKTHNKIDNKIDPLFPFPKNGLESSPTEIKQWRIEVYAWIKKQSAVLEGLILNYDPFNLIANVTFNEIGWNPETYKETEHHGLAAVVEFITLLFLKHPYNSNNPEVIINQDFNRIINLARAIVNTTNLYYSIEPLEGEYSDNFWLSRIRSKTISENLIVRSPNYQHHQILNLRNIFNPISDWLTNTIGFSCEDVICINEIISSLMMDKFYLRRDEARNKHIEIIETVKSLRFDKSNIGTNSVYLLELSKMKMKDVRKIIARDLSQWVFTSLGTETFSFSIEELLTKCDIPKERITKIIDFFSIKFGEIDKDFSIPAPHHKLLTFPFIKNENKMLYPVPNSLIWAFQPRVEEIMNPNTKNPLNRDLNIWEQYLRTRADYLESESINLISTALQSEKHYQGLFYEVKESNIIKQAELDGLIEYDSTLFLIEAKSGGLTDSARRGSKERIKRDIKQLIGAAHNQALRAKEYITSNSNPTFKTKSGEIITINKQLYRRIILVTVTLEPLDTYNAVLRETAKAGLVNFANELPWAVSLDDLRVICETIEFPSQLIHYLLRRMRINEIDNIETHDELDWFGNYLQQGLYFEKEAKNNQPVTLLSYTTKFDDYYFYKMGLRKKIEIKPHQSMPELFHEIILNIEKNKESKGHSEAVIQLLDWNETSRDEFLKMFTKIRKMTIKDNHVHDFSLLSTEASSGITCFSCNTRNSDEAFEKLCVYVPAKKYQQKYDHWLGLLTVVNEKDLIHGMVSGVFPWEFDSEEEINIKLLFP